jgi:hypothetical protein
MDEKSSTLSREKPEVAAEHFWYDDAAKNPVF